MSDDRLSAAVTKKLSELLEGAYPVARNSLIYAEVVTGEFNYLGVAELRDVLDHIKRAVSTSDEEEALKDIEAANEHIRRCAVESVQRAATKTFFDALKVVRYPHWIYKVLLLDLPDKERIRDLRMTAMEKIASGRSHKSDKSQWITSLKDFETAIDSCFEIIDMCPSKNQIRFQAFSIVCGIITIVSLVVAIACLT